MWILLVIVAGIATAIGFLSLSQATMGVGILAVACILGVFARIAQANKYQHDLIEAINLREKQTNSPAGNTPVMPVPPTTP
jgi:hypothetical protein